MFQMCDISSLFCFIEDGCQRELTIWTFLTTKWDVDIEIQKKTENDKINPRNRKSIVANRKNANLAY